MSKQTSNIFSFLLGVGAGVVLGILVAPKSGEETREDIKEKFENIKDKVEDIYEKGKEKTSDILQKGNEVLDKIKRKHE